MKIVNGEMVFEELHLFCGSGGGALGFQQAQHEYKGIKGRFETICGIDVDPLCCIDFEKLTGSRAVEMDLFDRQQYIDFWGKEPPLEWREVTPDDIKKACKGRIPDGVFLSPPCKGFSGLLPEKTSKSAKYQALNRLVTRSIFLTVEAFRDDLPAFILLENVPRIKSRGKELLREVTGMLKQYGYVFHKEDYDCGEFGGLGQTRKRFLLIARNPVKVPSFIYEPIRHNLKSIGEILGPLPIPGDIEKAGIMHRLPNLAWKTWVRLALIPAGGDWRDLNRKCYANVYQVVPWDKPGSTVTGAYRPNNGAISIADKRVEEQKSNWKRTSIMKVLSWDEASGTVMGSANIHGTGSAIVSDPRINHMPRSGAYRIVKWDESSPTITGSTGAGKSNGISGIEDPRLNCEQRSGSYRVLRWDKPANTILGALTIHNGAGTVADPRIPSENDKGIWLIIAEDGTWHRPITNLEMAALQGLPATFPDGSPLVLAGNSEKIWREHIGNMVPPPAACGIANTLLATMMPNYMNEWHWGFSDDRIWVMPSDEKDEQIYEIS